MDATSPQCPGFEVIDGPDGPWDAGCTRIGCSCKKPAQVSKRYVEPGFTAAMLAEIDDEEW